MFRCPRPARLSCERRRRAVAGPRRARHLVGGHGYPEACALQLDASDSLRAALDRADAHNREGDPETPNRLLERWGASYTEMADQYEADHDPAAYPPRPVTPTQAR